MPLDGLSSSLNITQSMLKQLSSSPIYEPPRNNHLADRQYEILCEYIKDFQDGLDSDQEVCVQLASFGQNILMQVTNIGYANPCLITFEGYVSGQYCQLVQHVNQLSFLLMSSPKAEPDKPARRIGFDIPLSE